MKFLNYTHILLKNFLFKSLVLLFIYFQSQAQSFENYPVQATAYFAGSSSQRLSDYFTSNTRLGLDLLLKDLTKSNVQVYLRIALEGPSIRVFTRDGYVPASFINLQAGTILKLHGNDLQSQYFNPDALEAEGIDINNVYNLSLPEGFYTLKVQALEAGTGREVSNLSEAFFVASSPLPPTLNLPLIGSESIATKLQKTVFQWTPRHYAVAGSKVVYKLQVCEVPEAFEPDQNSIDNCLNPIVNTTIDGTTYIGDATNFIKPLELGKRYAVQVKAIDLNGQLTNFGNDGNSEVSWFRYGKECLPPSFKINNLGTNRVEIEVEAVDQAESYLIVYQETGTTVSRTIRTVGTRAVIDSLNPTKTYQFWVQTDCGGSQLSVASETQEWSILENAEELEEQLPVELLDPLTLIIETDENGVNKNPTKLEDLYEGAVLSPVSSKTSVPAADAISSVPKLIIPECAMIASGFEGCSPNPDPMDLPVGIDLKNLKVGDVLGIYEYAVFVTTVSSNVAGVMSGRGLVKLPFLKNTKALVSFERILAKEDPNGGNGGCVYQVNGHFKVLEATQAEVLAEETALINTVQNRPPTAFRGTFQEALKKYDETANTIKTKLDAGLPLTATDKAQVLTFTNAILAGSKSFKESFEATYGGSSNPLAKEILDELKALTDKLEADKATISNPTSTTTPLTTDIEAKYNTLFEKLRLLKEDTKPPTSTEFPIITGVSVNKITETTAEISWQGDPRFTSYTVTYEAENGAILTETVSSPTAKLTGLQTGQKYKFSVQGYVGTELVANTTKKQFETVLRTIPPPENLISVEQADGSVKIKWDKNSKHFKYKVVYKDKLGDLRTLYPSTNETTLKGLDLDFKYQYEVIAYSKDFLESSPANSNFRLGFVCEFNLTASKAIILEGESVILTAPECSGRLLWWDFTFSTSKSVSPVETTTYKATCIGTDSKGATITCDKDLKIIVLKKCNGVNIIQPPNVPILKQGEPIVLTANGCVSDFTWGKLNSLNANNYTNTKIGFTKSITTYTSGDSKYLLTCKDINQNTCNAVSDVITVKCDLALRYFLEDWDTRDISFERLEELHEGALVVGNPKYLESYLKKINEVTVTAVGCQSKNIEWIVENNLKFKKNEYNKITFKRKKRSKIEVLANCINGISSCVEKIDIPSINTYENGVYCKGEMRYLPGNKVELKLNNEIKIIDQTTNSQMITMGIGSCINNFAIEPILPNKAEAPLKYPCNEFKITATSPDFYPCSVISLSTTCPSNGIVSWESPNVLDNKVSFRAKGNYEIAGNCTVDGIVTNGKTNIEIKDPKFEILTEQNTELDEGEPITLTANCTNGCEKGTVKWYNGSTLLSTAQGKSTLTTKANYANQTYKAVCSLGSKEPLIVEKKFNVKPLPPYNPDPCDFKVYFNQTEYQVNDMIRVKVWNADANMSITSSNGPRLLKGDVEGNWTYWTSETVIFANHLGPLKYTIINKTCNMVDVVLPFVFKIGEFAKINFPVVETTQTPTNQSDCSKYSPGSTCETWGLPMHAPGSTYNYFKDVKSNFAIFGKVLDISKWNETTIPERLGLVDKTCFNNGGTIAFFSDEFRTSNNSLGAKKGIYAGGNLVMDYIEVATPIKDGALLKATYYGRCTNKDGSVCLTTLKFDPQQNDKWKICTNKSGARISGINEDFGLESNSTAVTTLEESNCLPVAAKETAKVLINDLLCKKLLLVGGNEEYKLYLLKEELSKLGINIGNITPVIVQKLKDGECNEVATLLTSVITGTVSYEGINKLLNQSDDILSNIVENISLNEELIRDTDFSNRIIHDFEIIVTSSASISSSKAKVGAKSTTTVTNRLCSDYYFAPNGKRIIIDGITNCELSRNFVLEKFTKDTKNYVALYSVQSNAFLGYHEETDFQSNSIEKTDKLGKPYLQTAPGFKLNNDWFSAIQYPEEAKGVDRFKAFFEANKTVIQNPGLYEVVLDLIKDLPDFFNEVESSTSPFYYKLDVLLQKLLVLNNFVISKKTTIDAILNDPNFNCDGKVDVGDSKGCKLSKCVYDEIKYFEKDVLNKSLDIETRKKIITALAEGSITSTAVGPLCDFNQNEHTIISLIKSTPQGQVFGPINLLSHLNNNNLLQTIIDKTSGSNYAELIKAVTAMELSSTDAVQHYFRFDTDEEIIENIEKRFIHYQKAGIYEMNFIGKTEYDVSFADGKVNITKKEVIGTTTIPQYLGRGGPVQVEIPVWKTLNYSLNPFDLIVVNNNSNLSSIEGEMGIENDGVAVVPAIFMVYANDKINNFELCQQVALAGEVAAIAFSGGAAVAIRTGRLALASYEAFVVLGSGIGAASQIALDVDLVSAVNHPDFAEGITIYNNIMALLNIPLIFTNSQSGKTFGDVISKMGRSTQLYTIPKALGVRFLDFFNKIKSNPTIVAKLTQMGIVSQVGTKLSAMATYLTKKGLSAAQVVPRGFMGSSRLAAYGRTVAANAMVLISSFNVIDNAALAANAGIIQRAMLTTPAAIGIVENGVVLTSNIRGAFVAVGSFKDLAIGSSRIIEGINDIGRAAMSEAASVAAIEANMGIYLLENGVNFSFQRIIQGAFDVIKITTENTSGHKSSVLLAKENPDADNSSCKACKTTRPSICKLIDDFVAKFTGNDLTKYEAIVKTKLCQSEISDTELGGMMLVMNKFTTQKSKDFLNDINVDLDAKRNSLTLQIISTWSYLYDNHPDKAKFARVDWNTLTNFGKLNANVKAEIVLFTDASATTSRIIEFCNDLKNTNGFITFLNKANYAIYSNGFLGYRNDPKHNYKAEDYEVLTDEISNLGLNQTLADMIGSWLDHATDATTRNGYYKKGKQFESWVKVELSKGQTSLVYQQIQTYFNNLPASEKFDIDSYSIYSQVYFCINGSQSADCINEGEYFIADFVFVRKIENDPLLGTYLDVRIADTKLSANTAFTTNQNKSKLQNKLYLRKTVLPIKGNPIDLFKSPVDFTNTKIIYKIYSDGTSSALGGITK